jgi:hypothetical protein
VSRDELLVDQPDRVATAVRALAARGDLLAMTVPKPLPDGSGRVAVRVRLRGEVLHKVPTGAAPNLRPRRVRSSPSSRRQRVIAGSVAGAGLLVGVGYLVYRAWPLILATLVLLAVIWYGLGRVGACPGIHCPGCRHR